MSRPEFSGKTQRPGDGGASRAENFISDSDTVGVLAGDTSISTTAISPVDRLHIFHSVNAVETTGNHDPNIICNVRIRDPNELETVLSRKISLAQMPFDPNSAIPVPEGYELDIWFENETDVDIEVRYDVNWVTS